VIAFLFEREGVDVNYPCGRDPLGSIIDAQSARFPVQFMSRERSFDSGDQLIATPEEIEVASKGCISYYAPCRVDAAAGFFVHQLEGALIWEPFG
jgi:hypothetical protein